MNRHVPPTALALFDLDHTLLAADTNELWLNFLVDEGCIDGPRTLARQARYYDDYLAGRLDIGAYLAFQLETLAGRTLAELLPLRARFAHTRLLPALAPQAAALVAGHRAQGHRCAIVSATHRFLVEPAAQALGIADLLVTEAELVDGRFSGALCGQPCFRELKPLRVEAWRSEEGLSGALPSWFYSDSLNDLALLERVDHPVAVDPDPALAAAAARRGWTVISLR